LALKEPGTDQVFPRTIHHAWNFKKIVAQCGAKEVHVLAPGTAQSRMEYRNPNCFMGGELRPPEFSIMVTDANRVGAFVSAAREI